MSDDFTIGIGTVGAGMWFSYDSGGAWRHIYKFVNPEGNVRAVRVDPSDPKRILAASDRAGLFQSEDGGYRWFPLASPITDCDIWTLTIDPTDPDRIYVGNAARHLALDRPGETLGAARDGHGPRLPHRHLPHDERRGRPPRPRVVWAGIEVDGVYRSDDGGDNWTHLDDIGPPAFHGDVHGLAVRAPRRRAPTCSRGHPLRPGHQHRRRRHVELAVVRRLRPKGSGNPYAYCRGVFVSPERPRHRARRLRRLHPRRGRLRSRSPATAAAASPGPPLDANSTVYWMAMHPDVPGVIAASSVFGQIFLSRDRGDSWSKLDREFGEIRSITLSPT